MFSAANRSSIDFAIARFARLGPTLLFCSTITFSVLFIAPMDGLTVNLKLWLASVLVAPLTFHDGIDWSLWSLKYEIVFYALIFGLLAFGMSSRRLKILSCVLIISDLIETFAPTDQGEIRGWFGHYGAYFVVGILFHLRSKGEARLLPLWIAAILTSLVDSWKELQRAEVSVLHHQGPSLMQCVLAGLLVIGIFAVFLGGTESRTFGKVCALAGSASYPLYVLHQLLGYRLIAWAKELLSLDMMIIRLFTIGLMVLFAGAFAFVIEKPRAMHETG